MSRRYKEKQDKKKATRANVVMSLKEMTEGIGELAEMVEKKVDSFEKKVEAVEKRLDKIESRFSSNVDFNKRHKKQE